ncbi:hypothetical protein PGT21_035721 [Puccinia graminis f. sp. tritici]|uniref:Carboxypeptidase n=2 Tax=Puccinia graminis f. sp. tritici TaxID=56615 RepID=A0A5B0M8J6_PUCGR|nr:hypothetical protein PGTUg99_027847 [Puccinia graminis f. sp. tritici]KAA1084815.1 hypothetical protein PGT21_035721 [Puccinia graminis f. sp. tritici]
MNLVLARCILWIGFHHFLLADSSQQQSSRPASLQFSSAQARKFSVPRKLPQMDFEIDASYAGLLDISKGPHEEAKIFFWFIPAHNALGANELTLWSNGGPGCSSMIGAFQENGPIMWDPGRTSAIKNPYSWHTRSSMLYVDHPIGVGYSVGKAVIDNEYQVADYLCRFLEAWLKVFPEMSQKNFYLAGESYAGMYLSYTAATIHAKKHQIPLPLKGLLLVDAVFSDTLLQEQAPLYTFVEKHQSTFKFDESFMAKLNQTDKSCGYSQYLQKHLVYPPRGFLPDLTLATSSKNPKLVKPQCNIVTMMNQHLPIGFQTYNILWKKAFDYALDPFLTYFDMLDVKEAFNVDGERKWHACLQSNQLLFPKGDQSPPPALTVLPDVIKKNKRTVLAQGSLDAVLFMDGTKLALQNLTWNGDLGFQKPIDQTFSIGGKAMGRYNSERGLTYIEVEDSGHKLPHDKPEAALQILDFLLGHSNSPSSP